MKISYLKDRTGETIDLNKLIFDNSIELNSSTDLDALIEIIGDSKYVLLGEASHGTHEYYTWRTEISKKLIQKKGFSFIAVEGDWPDCYRINRYIKNYIDSGKSAVDVLHKFNRWPTWMWANWEIVALTEWLKNHNSSLPKSRKTGFYGLDVYSLWESFDTIIKYLDKEDPKTKQTAKNALKCFEPYSEGEGQAYASATLMIPSICEEAVIDLLTQVRKNMISYNTDPEAVMSAEQNAHVIVNAERYYRAMVKPGPESWNIRDHHMVDTLNRLIKFHGSESKAIIWEHNTHIGDARATDMVREGTVNVGQLLNEQHKDDGVFSVGFGSFKGTVIAGREWGDVMRIMNLPDAIPDSWEFLLHQLDSKNRIIFMNEEMKKQIGKKEFGHRAIGVVYHPQYEYLGNYVPSLMPHRYDAFVYIDETSALHPLHMKPDGHQMPETFPFGM
ncbi:MAG: erythromycin esterase family protein [Bacteroidetes bacterium]|nr:erythromycin esterase family protein [Bacteroidota bacterium]